MKERIDKLLLDRGLVRSRQQAQALILGGDVLAGEQRIDKPGTKVDITAEIRLKISASALRVAWRTETGEGTRSLRARYP